MKESTKELYNYLASYIDKAFEIFVEGNEEEMSSKKLGGSGNLIVSAAIKELTKTLKYELVNVIGYDNKIYQLDSYKIAEDLLAAKIKYPDIDYKNILLETDNQYCIKEGKLYYCDEPEVGKYLMATNAPTLFFEYAFEYGIGFLCPNTYKVMRELLDKYSKIHTKKSVLHQGGMINGFDINHRNFEVNYITEMINKGVTASSLCKLGSEYGLLEDYINRAQVTDISLYDLLYRVLIENMSETKAIDACINDKELYNIGYMGNYNTTIGFNNAFKGVIKSKIKEEQ